MVIMFLVIAACGAIGYFLFWFLEKFSCWLNAESRLLAAITFGFGGFVFALFLNQQIYGLIPPNGYEEITKKNISPIENPSGDEVYVVIAKETIYGNIMQGGEKVEYVLFLMGGKMNKERYKQFIEESAIFLPEDLEGLNMAWVQLVRPKRDDFWKYFVFYPKEERYFIPPSGIRWGKIRETYKFIP